MQHNPRHIIGAYMILFLPLQIAKAQRNLSISCGSILGEKIANNLK